MILLGVAPPLGYGFLTNSVYTNREVMLARVRQWPWIGSRHEWGETDRFPMAITYIRIWERGENEAELEKAIFEAAAALEVVVE